MIISAIGTRQLSPGWRSLIGSFSRAIGEAEWMLRTGAAQGSDQAWCEHMPHDNVSLYLPWPTYEHNWWKGGGYRIKHNPSAEAMKIARRYHPNWEKCTQGVRKLHARNSHILLGPECTRGSDLVVCYTVGGGDTGGTGQGIRLARREEIPVLNIHHPQQQQILWDLINGDTTYDDLFNS